MTVQEKSFEFALDIIELYKILLQKNDFVVSKQLLKSATSIWANVEEASAAQTKKDFYTKMTIASKEARETSLRHEAWSSRHDTSNITLLCIQHPASSIQHLVFK